MRSDRDQRDAYVKTLEKARISLTQTVEDVSQFLITQDSIY